MDKYVWLSFPLDTDGPHPPAIPQPSLSDLYTVERDGAGVQILTAASHTGTHVDMPQHVIENGLSVHDFSPQEFIYTAPALITVPAEDKQIITPEDLKPFYDYLSEADIALIRFGYTPVRSLNPKRYSTQCPGFGVEAAGYLRENFPNLRALGLDVPSLACIDRLKETMNSHNILFEGENRRFIVIEEMKLDDDLKDLIQVRINPWLVKNMDSGPCSVIGIVET